MFVLRSNAVNSAANRFDDLFVGRRDTDTEHNNNDRELFLAYGVLVFHPITPPGPL